MLKKLSRDTGNPLFAKLRPRELRSSFVTLARQAGVNERSLKRYVGHTPGDIMGTNYEAVKIDDLRTKVVDVFLGAYGKKLNAETSSPCCTNAAQTVNLVKLAGSVSAVKSMWAVEESNLQPSD